MDVGRKGPRAGFGCRFRCFMTSARTTAFITPTVIHEAVPRRCEFRLFGRGTTVGYVDLSTAPTRS